MIYNKNQVLSYLPHRDPFLFIDYVEEIILPKDKKRENIPFQATELIGTTSVCYFELKKDLTILQGHFPGNPILPGVVQVEMMAQASSFVASLCVGEDLTKIKIDVALLGVDKARFRKPITPPMKLKIQSTLIKTRGSIHVYDGKIFHQDELMSESTFLASIKFL